jgi:hypothetical protein
MPDHKGDHDRVVMASRHPDGSPDQTPDFTYIGDKEFSKSATAEQLKQQAVSAEDVRLRGAAAAGGGEGGSEPDDAVQKLIDAHESAAKGAEKTANAEVDSKFEDVEKESAEARRASGFETTASAPAAEKTVKR